METINTTQLLNVLKPYWKKILLVIACACVLGIFFSSPIFIEPQFKSNAVIYPTNLVNFGEESTTEQLLQYLNSEEIKLRLTKRFNLYNHYKIDTLEKYAVSKFNNYYGDHISISSTLYESVEIHVTDKSPKFAQDLCRAIIEEADNLVRKLKQDKVNEYMNSYTLQLRVQQHNIDSIEAKLKYYRTTYGLLDYKTQVKIVSKNSGKSNFSDDDKTLLNNLKVYGGEFTLLENSLATETAIYHDLKINYEKNKLDKNGNLSYSTIVSKPNLPDKKCFPNRIVIIGLFIISSLLIAVFAILITSKKQNELV